MTIVRYSAAALAAACLTSFAVAAPASASSTHSTDDFDFDADGLCAFTVHLTVHNEVDTTTRDTPDGGIALDHVTETDTVAAHGKTVQGLPYRYTVHRIFDNAGNQVSAVAQGGEWRFQLPDGGVWSAGGRTDFLTGMVVGSWEPADGLGPVCEALG